MAYCPVTLGSADFNKIINNISKVNNIFTISLKNQIISCDDFEVQFEIDKRRKEVLIQGIDDISETLKLSDKIKKYENNKALNNTLDI